MRVVVMGVTGSGKTTVGRRLAAEVRAQFADGDDFHSPDAVAKMAADVPLTDADRLPWLERVGQWLAAGDSRVVACSALKRSYRDVIRGFAPDAVFVHLAAEQSVLEERVGMRSQTTDHYAGPGLLDSQFATLEELEPDERGVRVDVTSAGPDEAAAIAHTALVAVEEADA